MYVFLSHDVDWRRQGPSKEHVMARKERFDSIVIKNLDKQNLYYNIPEIMEIEEKFGVKSTFFFRTMYENGDFEDYEDDIKSLVDGGWEVGLHCDPSSVDDIEKLRKEKEKLEGLTKTKLEGNRVHYLKFTKKLPKMLKDLGFSYDSSVRTSKDKIDKSDMGFQNFEGLIEFPVTLMDAYLFTYMKLEEKQIIPTFKQTIDYARKNDSKVITVIWHDNVLKMIGGRKYKDIVEFLTSQKDVKICRGTDLASIVKT
jgi:peptidoglycan/xylan/chitin deacetylase (PgdA/CDA1 family)